MLVLVAALPVATDNVSRGSWFYHGVYNFLFASWLRCLLGCVVGDDVAHVIGKEQIGVAIICCSHRNLVKITIDHIHHLMVWFGVFCCLPEIHFPFLYSATAKPPNGITFSPWMVSFRLFAVQDPRYTGFQLVHVRWLERRLFHAFISSTYALVLSIARFVIATRDLS